MEALLVQNSVVKNLRKEVKNDVSIKTGHIHTYAVQLARTVF
jgi:hypothetical protein